MDLKKSIFSYIVWAVFAFLCCAGVIFALDAAGIREMFNWSYVIIIVAACGYLLLTAVVFFAIRTLGREIGKNIKDKERFEEIISVVLPVIILIGGVVYLVCYVLYNAPLTLDDDSFYRQAVASTGKNVSYALHGASWLYPCLLHMILLVFGNTPFAGVVLQIVLFFACLLFLYIGMKSFAGVLPAAVSMAAFAFIPVSLQSVFSLTPELFYLALYLFGFCLIGTFFRKFRNRNYISPVQYLGIFLLGFYIGFLVYLDIYGVSLYFFLALFCSLGKEKMKQAVSVNLAALLGSIAGFGLLAAFAAWMGKMSLPEYLKVLFTLYTQNVGFQAETMKEVLLQPDMTLVGSLLLVSFAFFLIPTFFIRKRSQNSAFILNLFFVYALSVCSVFHLNAQIFLTFSWCVLAGLGFCGVTYPVKAEIEEDKEEEMPAATAEETKEALIEKEEEDKAPVTSVVQEIKVEMREALAAMKTEDEEPKSPGAGKMKDKTSEEKISGEKKKEQEKPAPGKPLHNPLPVPKKKRRRQADFGIEVKEADMKFDIEVADDDDFDV